MRADNVLWVTKETHEKYRQLAREKDIKICRLLDKIADYIIKNKEKI